MAQGAVKKSKAAAPKRYVYVASQGGEKADSKSVQHLHCSRSQERCPYHRTEETVLDQAEEDDKGMCCSIKPEVGLADHHCSENHIRFDGPDRTKPGGARWTLGAVGGRKEGQKQGEGEGEEDPQYQRWK